MTDSTKGYPVVKGDDIIIIDSKLYQIVYVNRAHYILKELYS